MRFSELDGATVGVWGAGREIRSFAAQLASRIPSARIAVLALDDPPEPGAHETLGPREAHETLGPREAHETLGPREAHETLGPREVHETPGLASARLASGGEILGALSTCDVVVRSPGVSIYRSELEALRAGGVPVTTATGLWLAETGGAGVIGITGTKGKSTTAALTHHLALAAGRQAHLAGNIGAPALDLLDIGGDEIAVVELSSYQIADLTRGPEIVVVTNLYREHVNWHRTEEAYAADKLRILGLPGVRASVLNGRDARLVEAATGRSNASFFGLPRGWDVTPAGVVCGERVVVGTGELPLRGEHNALNLCGALAALAVLGIAVADVAAALRDFDSLPHRLEVVHETDGVVWVDDSIATTPESTLAALQSFAGAEIVLLGGGEDRGQDYTVLARVLADRRAVVLGLPVTGSRLVDAVRLAGAPPERAFTVADMASAVEHARSAAGPGSVVLLSPGAPSFNMYTDFVQRGLHFQTLARGATDSA